MDMNYEGGKLSGSHKGLNESSPPMTIDTGNYQLTFNPLMNTGWRRTEDLDQQDFWNKEIWTDKTNQNHVWRKLEPYLEETRTTFEVENYPA